MLISARKRALSRRHRAQKTDTSSGASYYICTSRHTSTSTKSELESSHTLPSALFKQPSFAQRARFLRSIFRATSKTPKDAGLLMPMPTQPQSSNNFLFIADAAIYDTMPSSFILFQLVITTSSSRWSPAPPPVCRRQYSSLQEGDFDALMAYAEGIVYMGWGETRWVLGNFITIS